MIEYDIVPELVDALRSDHWGSLQGTQRLATRIDATTTKYCCFGVMCELLADKKILTRISNYATTSYFWPGDPTKVYDRVAFTAYPPNELLDAVGFKIHNEPNGDARQYYASLNDSGSNFQFIANEMQQYQLGTRES